MAKFGEIGGYSGGANPLGLMGEIDIAVPYVNGVAISEDDKNNEFVTYYSQHIVERILAFDTNVIDYVRKMIEIRKDRPKQT